MSETREKYNAGNPMRQGFIKRYGLPGRSFTQEEWDRIYKIYSTGWIDATDQNRQVAIKFQDALAEFLKLLEGRW